MSGAFDIASLGPHWRPFTSADSLSPVDLIAIRVPTEIGTRTMTGMFQRVVGDQITVQLKSGVCCTYSTRHIVAWCRNMYHR